jgi:calcineurin-like phosphoesterase family protein
MKTWITADTHFGHADIIRFCKRPFAALDEMNSELIRRWNSVVSDDDIVWHLGDFAFGDKAQTAELLGLLKGAKRLVKGNHDTQSNRFYRECGFEEVYDYPVIVNGFLILSHAPIDIINEYSVFGNIYGHVHDDERYITVTPHTACVSTEKWDYAPVGFDGLLAQMAAAKLRNSSGISQIHE